MATSTSKSSSAPSVSSSKSTTTTTSVPTKTSSASSVGKNISNLSNSTIQVAVGATPDGSYGPQTTAAVKAFQESKGLKADGIVGPQTAAAIAASLKEGNYGVAPKKETGGVASPSPVVSGGAAISEINNKIIPTINESKAAMANQALTQAEQKKANIKLQEDLNAKFGGLPGYKMLVTDGIVGPKTKAAMAFTPPEPKKEITPEDKIASELSPGNMYIYDNKTGEEKQIPITTPIPAGYAKTKPVIPTRGEEVQLFSGDKVVKMSDGTYHLVDMQGNDLGTSSETTFTQGKQANDVLVNLNNAMNGNYPLKPEQQAQIQGIQAGFQQLIKQQEIDNANATGATTIAMNRYGLGDQLVGTGNIVGIINDGAQEVANLNTKMASAVAQMTSAFKTDNLNALKDAYTAFKGAQDSLQANIDKMQSSTAAVLKAQQEAITKRQDELTKTVTETQKAAREAGVPPEVVASLSDATSVADMYKRLGNYAISAPGIIGEYAAYKNEMIARGSIPMDFNSFQNVDANRKKSIAAAGVEGSSGLNSKQEMYYDRIAKEYTNDTFIKNQAKFSAFRSIAQKIKDNPSNAANQLAGLYTLVKVLDPDSAVREGEVGLAQLTQSTTDNLKVQVERLAQGKIMTADTATKLAQGVLDLTDSWESVAQQRTNLYIGKAKGHGPEVSNAVNNFIDFDKSFIPTGTALANKETSADDKIANFTKAHPEKVQALIKAEESLKNKLGKSEIPASLFLTYYPEFGGQ